MSNFLTGIRLHVSKRWGMKKHKMEYKRHRISAGPQRDKYVDVLILEAKLGRPLFFGMEVDHVDGDSLNIDGSNLEEVTHNENMRRMRARKKLQKKLNSTPF